MNGRGGGGGEPRFWTPEYLASKLDRLRRARVSKLVLCIDTERNVGEGDLPPSAAVVRYRRRVDAAKVLEFVAAMDQRGLEAGSPPTEM